MKTLLSLFVLFAASLHAQVMQQGIVHGSAATVGTTFTLVQQVFGGNVACSPACPAITVSSTGSGNLLVLHASNSNGGARFVSSVSGGGTWVFPAGCQDSNGSVGAISCGYVLSSSSGVTSITPTMNTSDNYAVAVYEVSRTSGTWVLDTAPLFTLNSASATPAGQALTLTGSKDAIFQEIEVPAGPITAIGGGYNAITTTFGNQGATSYLLNTTSGTAPTWTNTTSQSSVVSAIGFK